LFAGFGDEQQVCDVLLSHFEAQLEARRIEFER
jgi:hypothetical protein